MLSTSALFRTVVSRLTPLCGEREARAVALLVLEEEFGLNQTDIYMDKITNFSPSQQVRLEEITTRLANGEPVQYVLGRARFCGHYFGVMSGVLIPRPETEELVEWVSAEALPADNLLDGGTGSGCIAISLKLRMPSLSVTAWDISQAAINIARSNALLLGADVEFVHADLLAPPAACHFDVIVSNPPYVRQSEKAGMSDGVVLHEPAEALFVPDADALRFYRALALLGKAAGARAVYCEINEFLPEETAALFRREGYDVEIRKDAFGKQRMLRATRRSETLSVQK